MIMKKVLLLSLALVVMFSASSCQKENVSLRTRSVSLSVVLPGAPATKAIADGEKALRLYYATYTEDGKMLSSLSNIVDGVAVSGKTATVHLQLVKDIEYHVVFWAQAASCTAFTFDWSNATMTVDYSGAANDDYRDAFYAVVNNLVVIDRTPTVDGQPLGSVGLVRPFAQVNFGASDYDSVTEYYDEASVDAGMQSSVVCAEVPNTLNLLDQSVGTSVVSMDMNLAQIPNDPKKLTVGTTDYRYVSMNYVLAPAGTQPEMLDEVTATFIYQAGNINRPISVKNVPILRNHRTNILGDFFTAETAITVIVMEGFTQPDLEPQKP